MAASRRANWASRIGLAVLAVYWVALFAATHVPRLRPELVPRYSDKTLHAAAYAVLAFLLAFAWSLRGKFSLRGALAALAIVAAYGAVDEATQPLVGRTAQTLDWVADVAGAAVGLAIFVLGKVALGLVYRES